jgi:uncharacterized protein YhfF
MRLMKVLIGEKTRSEPFLCGYNAGMSEEAIISYWQVYQASLPGGHSHRVVALPAAWGFGDGPEMADELGGLVVQGIKTATCSSVEEIKADGDPIPCVGDLSIILDGRGEPIGIIETTGIEIKPLDEVTAEFAYDEGEGDRSLDYWRDGHRRYFSRGHARLGIPMSDQIPVVCERFRLIFPVK